MSFGMSDDEHDALRRDSDVVGWIIFKWIAVAVGAAVIFSLVYVFWIRPAMLSGEAKTNRHSTQYSEAQRTFLLQKLSACQQLETDIRALKDNGGDPDLLAGKQAQLKAFIAEMRQRAALIGDKSAVPPEVTAYLNQPHPTE